MHKPLYRKPVRNLHALGLANEDADVNVQRKGWDSALIWAADYGTFPVVKALLARGAKIHAKNWDGCTALHYAAWHGRRKNVRLLTAAKANVNAKQNDGYTPLMGARNVMTARWLLRYGANVNARTREGWTPLMDAVLSKSQELVALLIANGADIHSRNDQGETALLFHTSLLNDYSHEADVRITQLLLQAGAQVNDYDHKRQSPLWQAVLRLSYGLKAGDTIRLLLETGAITNDEHGTLLLQWTRQKGFEEVAALLQAAGADMGATH